MKKNFPLIERALTARSFTFVAVFISLFGQSLSWAEMARSSLSVMTYNIWALPFPFSHAEWRYNEIAKRLSEYDVVAFQEAWSESASVVWKIPSHPYHAFGGREHGVIDGSGLIIISKYPIVASRFQKYQTCSSDAECIESKGVLMVRVRLTPKVEIDIYTTHTNAWEEEHLVRTSQILELTDFISENSINRPVIVMGDLNSDFGSINYDEIKGNLADLHDSYDEYMSNNSGASPDEKNGFTYDVFRNPWAAPAISHEDHSQRLDYIFYRNSSDVKFTTLSSRLTFTRPIRDGKPLSDHFGVATDFEIKALDPK